MSENNRDSTTAPSRLSKLSYHYLKTMRMYWTLNSYIKACERNGDSDKLLDFMISIDILEDPTVN